MDIDPRNVWTVSTVNGYYGAGPDLRAIFSSEDKAVAYRKSLLTKKLSNGQMWAPEEVTIEEVTLDEVEE